MKSGNLTLTASFFFFLSSLGLLLVVVLSMSGLLETLYAPLVALGDLMGLSPPLAFVVVGMLTTGAYVQWQFNHGKDDDSDDGHED